MKTGLIIVDAWSVDYNSTVSEGQIPNWSLEVKDNVRNFCNFLNYVCDVERKKGTTIVHSLGYTNPMGTDVKGLKRAGLKSIEEASELKIHKEDEVSYAHDLGKTIRENNLDLLYFCGFHFGKCIQMHIDLVFGDIKTMKNNRNIILNLCMILKPPKNAETRKHKNSWKGDIDEKRFNYFMWSPWRFEKILGNG